MLSINIPLSWLCRIYTTATEINRILERCQKESRTVDTESLCIIAGKKLRSVVIVVVCVYKTFFSCL